MFQKLYIKISQVYFSSLSRTVGYLNTFFLDANLGSIIVRFKKNLFCDVLDQFENIGLLQTVRCRVQMPVSFLIKLFVKKKKN